MAGPTVDDLGPPRAIRAFNLARGLVRPWLKDEFDERRVLVAARRAAGFQDFGPGDVRTPLGRLLRALDRDAGLSEFGRAAMRAHVVGALAKRLRVEECVARHPGILEERTERPLFIVGWPRSGTTHLHHLLCADPRVRAPSFWQLREPTPPPDVRIGVADPRVRRAEASIARGLRLTPALAVLHAHSATGPEECQHLLDLAVMNPLLPAGREYESWWREQDLAAAYRYHQRVLRLLQFRWPGQHWVLKGAFHLWHLDALSQVYPDANFVFTHRSPERVIPSAASYAAVRTRAFLRNYDAQALGTEVLDSLAKLMTTGLRHRESLDESRVFDVQYRDLVGSPLNVAEAICRHFDYPFDETTRQAMARYVSAHPQHKAGVHRYDGATFGLTPARIQAATQTHASFVKARGLELSEP